MEFAALHFNINPNLPVRQCGFARAYEPILSVHDDLYLRFCLVKKDGNVLIYVSLDNIGLLENQAARFKELAIAKYGRKTNVIVSCTHTHFGGDPHDSVYSQQLFYAFNLALETAHPREVGEIRFAYRSRDVDLGDLFARTHKNATMRLQTFSLYAQNHRIATFIIHNTHPAILSAETAFFSAEYPGALLKMCSVSCPGEFFSYMQGADGDVDLHVPSLNRTYDEVRRFARHLHALLETMMDDETRPQPLDYHVDEHMIVMEDSHTDDSIHAARILPVTRVLFKGYTQLFVQNELKSRYLQALPIGNASLICHSQGDRLSLADPSLPATVCGAFVDPHSQTAKKRLFDTLYRLSH
jgi:hypothetical protein